MQTDSNKTVILEQVERLIITKIKCLNCNETIESKHRHDLVKCKCENCYIDGGQDYLHFGGKDYNKILVIFDDGTEILASDEEKYKKKYEEWEDNNY